MEHLDVLITKYYWGLITRGELEALVFEESTIAAGEICSPNSPEFLGVWERIGDEYNAYVTEQLGGWHGQVLHHSV